MRRIAMMTDLKRIVSALALCCAFASTSAVASSDIGPREVDDLRKGGESIALIDIRSQSDFDEKHIQGSMNIPARVVNPDRIPSSRMVVIYGCGLGGADCASVTESLAAAGHNHVRRLRGGLAAWESAGLPTTEETGFRRERTPAITYQTLSEAQGRGVVLYDVREEASEVSAEPLAASEGSDADSGSSGLTDLRETFPQARVVRAAEVREQREERRRYSAQELAAGEVPETSPRVTVPAVDPEEELTVVIDDGDGRGVEIVREMRARGNKRVVLLAGGERILRRDGRSGLERQGLGMRVMDASELEQEGND